MAKKIPCVSGMCGVKEHVVGTIAHTQCMKKAYQNKYPDKDVRIKPVPSHHHGAWLSVLDDSQLDDLRSYVLKKQGEDDYGDPEYFELNDDQLIALAYDERNHHDLLQRDKLPDEVITHIARTTTDKHVILNSSAYSSDRDIFKWLKSDNEEHCEITKDLYNRVKFDGQDERAFKARFERFFKNDKELVDKIAQEEDAPSSWVVEYCSYPIARDLAMKNPEDYLGAFVRYRAKDMTQEDAKAIYSDPEIGKHAYWDMDQMVTRNLAPKEDYAQLLKDYFSNFHLCMSIAHRQQTIESVQVFDEYLSGSSGGDGLRETLKQNVFYEKIAQDMERQGIKRPKILGIPQEN